MLNRLRSTVPTLSSAVLAATLVGGALLTFPAATPVVALGASVSAPASLTQGPDGLQRAVRLETPVVTAPSLPAEVQAILDLVNAERTSRNLAPVSYHAQLTEAALAHAADQYPKNCLTTLTHTGSDGSDPGDRIARTGLKVRTWGENIACNQRTPAQVMTAWMNSPGHRSNILSPAFTHIGISMTPDVNGRLYWMQVFGTPR